MIRRPLSLLVATALLAAACVGSTGQERFTFEALAAGPASLTRAGSYRFVNELGYEVELTRAELLVGALYLNVARANATERPTSCILPGTYAAEVTRGRVVDVLDATLQPFPVLGDATEERARTAEVWLTGGRVDAEDDRAAIAVFEGTARRGDVAVRFEGSVTLGKNRSVASENPATPGASPLCTMRIVSPIALDAPLEKGGRLVVRIDAAGWFRQVDFAALPGDGPVRRFPDATEGQPATALFHGLRATSGTYSVSWERP